MIEVKINGLIAPALDGGRDSSDLEGTHKDLLDAHRELMARKEQSKRFDGEN